LDVLEEAELKWVFWEPGMLAEDLLLGEMVGNILVAESPVDKGVVPGYQNDRNKMLSNSKVTMFE
jgi:hypothetical protein